MPGMTEIAHALHEQAARGVEIVAGSLSVLCGRKARLPALRVGTDCGKAIPSAFVASLTKGRRRPSLRRGRRALTSWLKIGLTGKWSRGDVPEPDLMPDAR